MAAKTVTCIPPTKSMTTKSTKNSIEKRKVAGYARVSTDSDEQFTSYEAQIDYYTQYIKSHAEWEFVNVYTDEGITGTNTKHRDGFNEMIADALAGKINLIVTKSVSRFARNTVDTLIYVRKLKKHGIEVFFEKENIYTFDGKGELLITIMSSLAQEESRSISENVTWGQRKRFSDGKVAMPYKRFLGYKKGADGLPEIVPEEAEIVRNIYKMFVNGLTPSVIAKQLTDENILTPGGKTVWASSTVKSILTNEKYKGDALLQKTFTVDFLTKKMKPNEGEIPKYYVQNSHPAIIDPEEWEFVQTEMERRKNANKRYRCNDILSSRIVCADCGEYYGPKLWHSTDKYKKTIWQCNAKFAHHCQTPSLSEGVVKAGFVLAINRLNEMKAKIIEDCRLMQSMLTDCSKIDKDIESQAQEVAIRNDYIQKLIDESIGVVIEQKEFIEKYNELMDRYKQEKAVLDKLKHEKAERVRKADYIAAFMFKIQELETIDCFNNRLWTTLIDKVICSKDNKLVYQFANGQNIEIMISDIEV